MVRHRRRALRTGGAALVFGALLLAGCGGGDSAPEGASGGASSGTAAGTAKIMKFTVPESTPCPATSTFTTVEVHYRTAGAERAELRVDGRPIALADPATGTVNADVRCDPLPHDFVLIAYDADDGLTVEQRLLNTTR